MKFNSKQTLKWALGISILTLILAAIFSIVSALILGGVPIGIGMLVVFIIILIGVIFDTIGLAAAAANEVPFHAMASEKVKGAKQAIRICHNADRFSSFCNDVIGDISGIVSGTASAIVVLQLVFDLGHTEDSAMHFVLAVVFTSIVAALTVGGKAFGKSIAIHFSTNIILKVGKIFYLLEQNFNIKIFNGKSKNGKKKKKNRTK